MSFGLHRYSYCFENCRTLVNISERSVFLSNNWTSEPRLMRSTEICAVLELDKLLQRRTTIQ